MSPQDPDSLSEIGSFQGYGSIPLLRSPTPPSAFSDLEVSRFGPKAFAVECPEYSHAAAICQANHKSHDLHNNSGTLPLTEEGVPASKTVSVENKHMLLDA